MDNGIGSYIARSYGHPTIAVFTTLADGTSLLRG
jgi:hypothetical protein